MVKNHSQNFVKYHGCGFFYHDGTKRIVSKGRKCICSSYEPFWKRPINVRNRVETRFQKSSKSLVNNEYVKI